MSDTRSDSVGAVRHIGDRIRSGPDEVGEGIPWPGFWIGLGLLSFNIDKIRALLGV